jgi:hypothetical protein
LLGLFFNPEDGGDMFLRSVGDFDGLHGVISQKIEVFTTSVRRTGLLVTCFMLVSSFGLFFSPEDGGYMFFRNIGDFEWTTRRYIGVVSCCLCRESYETHK